MWFVFALVGCRGAPSALTTAGVVRSRTDTTDVLEAVWRVPAHPNSGGRVRWLYLPSDDTTGITVSAAVRAALVARGVPASVHFPALHDTVVYQLRGWTRDSAGFPVLKISSRWTHMSTTVPGICMSGGNVETYSVHRTRAGWQAERIEPVLHGDGYC